jgi:glucose-fructose oxidoreductase
MLRFSGGRLATFVTSFGSADQSCYKIVGTRGSLEVEHAYEWQSSISHLLKIGDRKTKTEYAKRDQFGPEIIYFSDCILNNKDPEPSGKEGLLDVKVIQALYKSAETGEAIRLSVDSKEKRPGIDQSIREPALKETQDLIHASAPHS